MSESGISDHPQDAGRLFLAVSLTAEARSDIAAHLHAAPVPLPGRPVPPSGWHLTLRFLGDTPRPAADRLDARLRDADLGGAFDLRFGGLGAFPRETRASVVWMGVTEGEARLRELAVVVEAAVVAAGFPPEPRPFSPHLTLARLRPPGDTGAALRTVPPLDLRMPVDEVVLYRSHLGAGPPRYEALTRYGLRLRRLRITNYE